MNKLTKKLISPLKCNRGASLVSVLITMFFLTYMGGAILHTSYTIALIKNTHSNYVKTTYTTDELTSYIKTGFQNIASAAAHEEYENTVENYLNLKTLFGTKMINNILNTSIDLEKVAMQSGIDFEANAEFVYNTAILGVFLTQAGVNINDIYIAGHTSEDLANAPIQISGNLQEIPTAVSGYIKNGGSIKYTDSKLTFEEITISYTNPSTDIKTQITTDISINVPNFFENENHDTNMQFSPIAQYAVIAGENLQINGKINSGNIYANEITLEKNKQTNIKGTLITPSAIILPIGHSITVEENSTVWAKSIVLEENAKLTSEKNSNVYIENDLALNEQYAQAVISGNLYGFGNSETQADKSSAVMINAPNTSLDFSQAQRIMLAGNAFIVPNSDDETQSEILIGESVSIQNTQSAYLAPMQILPTSITSNPYTVQTGAPLPDIGAIDTSIPIINENSLAYYSASVTQLIYPSQVANYSDVYYYLKFDTPKGASNYFKDYFAANTEQISNYLSVYTNLSTYSEYIKANGNIIAKNEDGTYAIPITNAVSASSALFMQNTYTNVCKSLTDTQSTAKNPFEYIVNTAAVSEFTSKNVSSGGVFEFNDELGNTVAVVTSSPFVLNSDIYRDLKIIISTQNVSINTEFSGIVLSSKNVVLGENASLTSDESGAIFAFNALFNGEISLLSLLASNGNTFENTSKLESYYDITDCVNFENYSVG